jgi:hypothetical protein
MVKLRVRKKDMPRQHQCGLLQTLVCGPAEVIATVPILPRGDYAANYLGSNLL